MSLDTLIGDVFITLGVLTVIVALCVPPKYDPAIRWKERLEGWKKRP